MNLLLFFLNVPRLFNSFVTHVETAGLTHQIAYFNSRGWRRLKGQWKRKMCACNQKLSSRSGGKLSNICSHPARALEADLISLSPVSLVYGLILSLLTSWKEAQETRSHLIQFCAARSVSSRAERKAIMKLWGFHKTINFIPSPRLSSLPPPPLHFRCRSKSDIEHGAKTRLGGNKM